MSESSGGNNYGLNILHLISFIDRSITSSQSKNTSRSSKLIQNLSNPQFFITPDKLGPKRSSLISGSTNQAGVVRKISTLTITSKLSTKSAKENPVTIAAISKELDNLSNQLSEIFPAFKSASVEADYNSFFSQNRIDGQTAQCKFKLRRL